MMSQKWLHNQKATPTPTDLGDNTFWLKVITFSLIITLLFPPAFLIALFGMFMYKIKENNNKYDNE